MAAQNMLISDERMSLHTPGPWRTDGFENIVVNAKNGNTIVAAPGTSTGTLAEMKANARLIAAAPDLLRLCKVLLKTVDVAFDRAEGDLLGIHHNDAIDAIEEAEQVIAKVEGMN